MISTKWCLIFLMLVGPAACGEGIGEVVGQETEDYLGEEPPGSTPRLFGSGIVSTARGALLPLSARKVFLELSEHVSNTVPA